MAAFVIDRTVNRASSAGHPHDHRPPAPDTAPSRESVAMPQVSVNGVAIPRKAIAAEVQNFPARNPGEGWRAATRALVIRELLLQEARRLDLPIEQRADADGRRETEEDALIRVLLEREVRVPEADDETLRRFYDNNRRRFLSAALYEADHILIAAHRDDATGYAAARDKASALAAVLADHPDRFAHFARDYSACPSASLGGNLGQISAGETTPEFEAALMKLRIGEISPPVETRYGIHVIRLVRRIERLQLPFEAVRDQIRTYLDDHVSRHAAAQYIALLAGRADIRGVVLDAASSPLVQ